MFVDAETSARLGPGDERCEKNDWRVLQLRIGPDLCRDFDSIPVGHDYINEDQIRPKIPGGLVRPGRVVFFEDHIAACLFEKNFDQMSRVLSLSTIRIRRAESPIESSQEKATSVSLGRKSTSMTLSYTYDEVAL